MMEGQACWHETGRVPKVSGGRSAATIDRWWRDGRAWMKPTKDGDESDNVDKYVSVLLSSRRRTALVAV
jgi:hypothetical protein